MNKTHCDVCDKEPAKHEFRCWPMMPNAATIVSAISFKITVDQREGKPADLCENCFATLLRAVLARMEK